MQIELAAALSPLSCSCWQQIGSGMRYAHHGWSLPSKQPGTGNCAVERGTAAVTVAGYRLRRALRALTDALSTHAAKVGAARTVAGARGV
jgi:hypothetical protein